GIPTDLHQLDPRAAVKTLRQHKAGDQAFARAVQVTIIDLRLVYVRHPGQFSMFWVERIEQQPELEGRRHGIELQVQVHLVKERRGNPRILLASPLTDVYGDLDHTK